MAEHQVNLNTASREELARIPGIGDECAERIIRHREEHGRINDVEELAHELKRFGEQAMRHLHEQGTV